jgi:hypothetical protein
MKIPAPLVGGMAHCPRLRGRVSGQRGHLSVSQLRPNPSPARHQKTYQINQWNWTVRGWSLLVVVDYHGALVGPDGKTNVATPTVDPAQPSAVGYEVMAPLVEKAIAMDEESAEGERRPISNENKKLKQMARRKGYGTSACSGLKYVEPGPRLYNDR